MTDTANTDNPGVPGTILGYVPARPSEEHWYVCDRTDDIYVKPWSSAQSDTVEMRSAKYNTRDTEVVAVCRLDGVPSTSTQPTPPKTDIVESMDAVLAHLSTVAFFPGSTLIEDLRAFRDRIVTQRAMSEAWDEGFESATSHIEAQSGRPPFDPPVNPYEE